MALLRPGFGPSARADWGAWACGILPAGPVVVTNDSVPEGEVEVRRGEHVFATDGAIAGCEGWSCTRVTIASPTSCLTRAISGARSGWPSRSVPSRTSRTASAQADQGRGTRPARDGASTNRAEALAAAPLPNFLPRLPATFSNGCPGAHCRSVWSVGNPTWPMPSHWGTHARSASLTGIP